MDFFNIFIEFVRYSFCFVFWSFDHKACGISSLTRDGAWAPALGARKPLRFFQGCFMVLLLH